MNGAGQRNPEWRREEMKREAAARRARGMLAEGTPHHFEGIVLVRVLHSTREVHIPSS